MDPLLHYLSLQLSRTAVDSPELARRREVLHERARGQRERRAQRRRVVRHPLHVVPPGATAVAPPAEPALTPRQREVLALLADGRRAKEIASRPSLSLPTVRNHIHALLRRLGVNSQLAAVAKARELRLSQRPSGVIPPPR